MYSENRSSFEFFRALSSPAQSCDTFRTATLPLLAKFGIEGLTFKISKRGAAPLGGGEVIFTCPIAKAHPLLTMFRIQIVKLIGFSMLQFSGVM